MNEADQPQSIPSPFEVNRMITDKEIAEVRRVLGAEKLLIAVLRRHNNTHQKAFFSVTGMCMHDVAGLIQILTTQPPPLPGECSGHGETTKEPVA